jgi:hypothetical protein
MTPMAREITDTCPITPTDARNELSYYRHRLKDEVNRLGKTSQEVQRTLEQGRQMREDEGLKERQHEQGRER